MKDKDDFEILLLFIIIFSTSYLQGETPLHLASQLGLLTLVKTLLKEGANPNTQTLYVEPPASTSRPKSKDTSYSKLLPPSHTVSSKPASLQSESANGSVNDSQLTSSYNSGFGTDLGIPSSLLLPNDTSEGYNPFELDEADNPFTEENDPSNPFTEELNNRSQYTVDREQEESK